MILFLQKPSIFTSDFLGASLLDIGVASPTLTIGIREKALALLNSVPLKAEHSLYS